jgi:hypothetical protein
MGLGRTLIGFLCLAAAGSMGHAQTATVSLVEKVKKGDCFHLRMTMELTGDMEGNRDGKQVPIKLSAKAVHEFSQRVLNVSDKGIADKTANLYEKADADIAVGADKSRRTLRPKRRLFVSQRHDDQPLHYSPGGLLTREELELVAESFDTMAITGLLPGKSVDQGDTWTVPNHVVQALCNFEGLTEQKLTCKLTKIKEKTVHITVSGTANGIDLGASVKLTIDAELEFDLKSKRLIALEWKQEDDREEGPASPASTVKTVTKIERKAIEMPDNLGDVALASVPDNFEPPARMTHLEYHDPKSRFDLGYGREWQAVAQTQDHLTLRLMERGDFVAQATVTPWTPSEKGKHLSGDEFKDAMAKTPGWEPDLELQAGEVPSDDGRWVYRISAQGKMDDETVVQNFYLIASPNGQQVVVAFTMKPTQVEKLGTRDLSLAGSLVFPKK